MLSLNLWVGSGWQVMNESGAMKHNEQKPKIKISNQNLELKFEQTFNVECVSKNLKSKLKISRCK